MDTPAVCRLCSFSCDEFKCLFENESETEIYKISIKYFSQSVRKFTWNNNWSRGTRAFLEEVANGLKYISRYQILYDFRNFY